MATLIRHWPRLLPLAALAILVAYLPPQRPAEPDVPRGAWQDYPTPEGRLAQRLGDDYFRAAGRAQVIALRDSLMRVLATRGARPGTVIALSPPRLDSTARAVAKAAAPAVASLSTDIRSAFALVPIEPTVWGTGANTYLPRATDGHTCIAMQAVDPRDQTPSLRHPTEALGPCTFFIAFGLPGREMQRWLESRQYEFAWDPGWSRAAHAPFPPDEPTLGLRVESLLSRLTTSDVTYYSPYQSVYWRSFSEAACGTGDVGACRRYFFTDSSARRSPIPGVIQDRPYFYSESNRVMSTLIREQGVDRFTHFWRSPLPPEQAFDSAFTVPFSRWAPAWVRTVGGSVRVDVVTRPGEIASSLAWIGLCVGACVGLALTRRVT